MNSLEQGRDVYVCANSFHGQNLRSAPLASGVSRSPDVGIVGYRRDVIHQVNSGKLREWITQFKERSSIYGTLRVTLRELVRGLTTCRTPHPSSPRRTW